MRRAIAAVTIVVASSLAPLSASEPDRAIMSDGEVVRTILLLSRAAYPGPCGCPEDINRAGNRCGDTSAKRRPRGRFVYCSPAEVTPGMVLDYRANVLQLPLSRREH